MPRDVNTPPSYAPDAVATTRGWVDAKTGELLVSVKNLKIKPVVIEKPKKPAKTKVEPVKDAEPTPTPVVSEEVPSEE